MYSSLAGCVLTEMEGVDGTDDKGDSGRMEYSGNTSLGCGILGTREPNLGSLLMM